MDTPTILMLIQKIWADAESSKIAADGNANASAMKNYNSGQAYAYNQAAQRVIAWAIQNNIELPNPIPKK